jgi:hypothetical protein
MAILQWDGFDHYKQQSDLLARSAFIQYQMWSGSSSFVTGRNGFGKALSLTVNDNGSNAAFQVSFGQRVASAFVGFATQGVTNQGLVLEFFDSIAGQCQCSVYFNPMNYAIQFYRGNLVGSGVGSTFLGASPNNVWQESTWNYFEIWPKVDNTTGSLDCYVNNKHVCSISGVDSQYSANAWWDVMQISGNGASKTIVIDDFYYGDTTTGPGIAPATTPIGDCKVATLFPVGNAAVAWTPLAGTNWQEVSEVQMDSDTSYNYSTTPTQEDILNFGTLPAGVATVYGVQVTGAYRKDDAAVRTIKQLVKSGATTTYGANNNIPDVTYAYFVDLFILNPTTGVNWTVIGVNGMSAGYNLVA